MEYHLSIDGERSGPYSQFAVIQRIRDGQVKKTDLIWRNGLDEWQSCENLEEFNGYWPLTEDEIQRAEQARNLARTELDRPQPWLRFWARILDYLWFIGIIAILVQIFLPAGAEKWIIQAAQNYIPLDSAIILCFVPIEALLLSRYGTTPGRALLRLQVRLRETGSLPSFRQALGRSFYVFVLGVALWLPLVSLLAMTWWRIHLLRKGSTPWDDRWGTRVEHGEPEIWRYITLGFILFLIVIMAIMSLVINPGAWPIPSPSQSS